MKTRLRLLAILVTFAGLFAGTWLLLGLSDREQNPSTPVTSPAPTKPESITERLIGTWEIVEHDPALPSNCTTVELEFTEDNRYYFRYSDSFFGMYPPIVGSYQLVGQVLRRDIPATADNPHQTTDMIIDIITPETLVLLGTGQKTRRVVCIRVREN